MDKKMKLLNLEEDQLLTRGEYKEVINKKLNIENANWINNGEDAKKE